MDVSNIYDPSEDSLLLQKAVHTYATGRVLDMGTGSGIQAITAMRKPEVKEVVALDINPEAVNTLQHKILQEKLRKIKALQSDLFEHAYGKFNTIIFNPPYLPQDKGIIDNAIYGGKKGWELSERFFQDVSAFLFFDGFIVFLFSTHTDKKKIEEIIFQQLLEFEEVGRQKLHFEELYVYRITKSQVLRDLETKGIEKIQYAAKGKRGLVFKGYLDRSQLVKTHFPSTKDVLPVAIKIPRPDSKASERIKNEAFWLAEANCNNIGPRLLWAEGNVMVSEFIEGELLVDWLEHHPAAEIRTVLVNLLRQCRALDELGITKEEMHHPQKHIIMDHHNRAILIDFERCSRTPKPKNVTQYLEFVCRLQDILTKKKIDVSAAELRAFAREYKEAYSSEIIENIIKLLSSR